MDTVILNNATQFPPRQFECFCKTFAIKHIKAILYHPRSNEQAECFVDTFKSTLKKPKAGETTDMFFITVFTWISGEN